MIPLYDEISTGATFRPTAEDKKVAPDVSLAEIARTLSDKTSETFDSKLSTLGATMERNEMLEFLEVVRVTLLCVYINLLSETRYGIETVHTPHESHDLREEVEGETVSFTRPKESKEWVVVRGGPLASPDAARHTHLYRTTKR